MLDAETKRRIDTARDILVGKVPDPKSQVEQITIALIYKFMDDMDGLSEELGGERSFFAGEFGQYGWAKLMQPGLGGHETRALYAEAIERMDQNVGIPQLFRDIFSNAFLPYRDPETLRAFLKVIDGFTYDHSERLGDAFEYLLSVMDSQGDAGQFRTPRHIIEFIVSIVDPKKEDAVLDPACGTAGFLISSYKHIRAANTDTDGNITLTPDDRERLARNLIGYDISPDMVRLSLVNMYLNGLVDPHIYEYDTLTSEDRWNEYADVILANPPFMSPKGGIRPHNRFSVESGRSEVLFVDYMAEHLNAGGRAGIIVPEGIIFKSDNAYKQLRKKLVEEYLVAVVSLPAGVFNPYSPVKTSILLLDRALAKRTERIAFFKVEHDGFDLGAQRRPIEENDLPLALSEISECLQRLKQEEMFDNFALKLGWVAARSDIRANDEYSLSGEEYQIDDSPLLSSYPIVSIGAHIKTLTPPKKIKRSNFSTSGRFPIIDQSITEIAGWTDDENAVIQPDQPLVIFGDHTCVVKLVKRPFVQGADGIKIIYTSDGLDPEFLYCFLRSHPLSTTGYRRHFTLLKKIKIPLPPLEVQREIVMEIEGFQKVIDGAQAVVENYRPHFHVDPEWPMVTFSEAPFEIIDGDRGVNYPKKEEFLSDGYCVFLNTKNVRPDGFDFGNVQFITNDKDKALRKGKLCRRDVVITTRGTVGNVGYYDSSVPFDHVRINSGMLIFRVDERGLSGEYLFTFFQSQNFKEQRDAIVSGSAQPQLPIRSLNQAILPLPSREAQETIVAEIREEKRLVNANRELIERFEKKIQHVIGRVWENEL